MNHGHIKLNTDFGFCGILIKQGLRISTTQKYAIEITYFTTGLIPLEYTGRQINIHSQYQLELSQWTKLFIGEQRTNWNRSLVSGSFQISRKKFGLKFVSWTVESWTLKIKHWFWISRKKYLVTNLLTGQLNHGHIKLNTAFGFQEKKIGLKFANWTVESWTEKNQHWFWFSRKKKLVTNLLTGQLIHGQKKINTDFSFQEKKIWSQIC